MSLKGSLETVSLTDVLTLLAMTKKTGELLVSGPHGDGRLWISEGQLVASSAGRGPSLIDSIFELLRVKSGTFSFDNGEEPPEAGPASDIAPALAEAATRLSLWDDIEASIPSLDYVVSMAPTAPSEEVMIRADQWRLLAATGGGRAVSAILDLLEVGEFDGCQALKELADGKLVTVDEPALEVPPPVAVATPTETPVEQSTNISAEKGSDEVDLSPLDSVGELDLAPVGSAEDGVDSASGFDLVQPVGAEADVTAVAPVWSNEPFEDADGIDPAFFTAVQPAPAASATIVDAYGLAAPAEALAHAAQDFHDHLGDQVLHAPEGDPGHEPAAAPGVMAAEAAEGDLAHDGHGAGEPDHVYVYGQSEPGLEAAPVYPTGGYQTRHAEYAGEPGSSGPDCRSDLYPGQVAEQIDAADGAAPPAVDEVDKPAEAEAKVTPAEEPINRGLLLKFLSSVRT